MGLEMISKNLHRGERYKKLCERETFWIFKMNALKPNGMNESLEASTYCDVCLYPIFFDGFEDQKEDIFTQILSDIQRILDQYKSDVIDLYSREFDGLLRRMDISVPSDFVKIAIESKLEDALLWYKGKKKCPFNKKTLEKLMEKSQRESLKSVILQKNFKKCTVEEAKERTAADMEACFMKVKDVFTQKVKGLHNQRFKSLKSQLWCPRNGPSRIWKLLEQEIKSLSKDKDMRELKQAVGKLFQMMSVSLNT
ncbi:uncharacterized protein [Hyperolius riggenbachi]|uniref:uncharacterized protein n=1 Tax=Hyperolius riggenbachi TaxID=752182 RepID=UPI0035A356D8